MNITWTVNNHTYTDELAVGSNHLTAIVRSGEVLKKVVATMHFEKSAKMFFNGYQTWTYCPEFTENDSIRGLNGLPRIIIDKFSLDRYSDYQFMEYPNKKGILHGVSYCYFRDGEKFRLLASLNEEPGYTCFVYNCASETMTITRDCSSLLIKENSDYPAFDLFYAEGSEDEVFDAWFDAMNIHNNPPKIKGYSSWYNHYQDISETKILDDLVGASKIFDNGDLFQIDDGWEPFVGDWLSVDSKKFPHSLSEMAKQIHDKGFKAGLWLAPFVCEEKSEIFKNHKDWLLTYGGKPWKAGCNWSGYYALDIDNPEVEQYIRTVFDKVFNEWGFDLVKLDFLYAAAPYGTLCPEEICDGPDNESMSALHKIYETRAARMIRAMKLLREVCAGKLILGCGVPVMPAFGLVDYCRISGDVGLDWDDKPYMRIIHRERVSTKHAIANTITRHGLDGRAHGNDPDVFFLRDNNIKLNTTEQDYLASLDAIYASVWLTSDNLNAYDERRTARYYSLEQNRRPARVKVDRDTYNLEFEAAGQTHSMLYPHPSK